MSEGTLMLAIDIDVLDDPEIFEGIARAIAEEGYDKERAVGIVAVVRDELKSIAHNGAVDLADLRYVLTNKLATDWRIPWKDAYHDVRLFKRGVLKCLATQRIAL